MWISESCQTVFGPREEAEEPRENIHAHLEPTNFNFEAVTLNLAISFAVLQSFERKKS